MTEDQGDIIISTLERMEQEYTTFLDLALNRLDTFVMLYLVALTVFLFYVMIRRN